MNSPRFHTVATVLPLAPINQSIRSSHRSLLPSLHLHHRIAPSPPNLARSPCAPHTIHARAQVQSDRTGSIRRAADMPSDRTLQLRALALHLAHPLQPQHPWLPNQPTNHAPRTPSTHRCQPVEPVQYRTHTPSSRHAGQPPHAAGCPRAAPCGPIRSAWRRCCRELPSGPWAGGALPGGYYRRAIQGGPYLYCDVGPHRTIPQGGGRPSRSPLTWDHGSR